jgi:23S rRNA (adenine2503-C2)-methyltransferase
VAEGADIELSSLNAVDLGAFVEKHGHPRYRADQIFRWIHGAAVSSIDEMKNVPGALRATLQEQATFASIRQERVELAADGVRKYAFRTHRGDIIESVFIPDASSEGRNTICISSQVGCALDCKFCLTASLGLKRNLSAGEIAQQVSHVENDVRAARSAGSPSKNRQIHNIVYMGMGEPLQNYEAVVGSIQLLASPLGQGFSPRRITVSTVGLAPRIRRLGEDCDVNLAVSLNATTNETRERIMPINRRYPIEDLLDACRSYPLARRRRITFEYVLLSEVNDTDDDARRLIRLVEGLKSKINLIPFNEHPFSPFKRPTPERVARFQDIVRAGGLSVFVRTPRGDDISAACGQLGAMVEGERTRLPILGNSA